MPLTPNNREEHWLQGMVDGSTSLEPNKRREYWYKEIVDAIGSGGGGGTGGGVLIVHDNEGMLDKTWQEIYDAANAGKYVVLRAEESMSGGTQVLFGAVTVFIFSSSPAYYSVEFYQAANAYISATADGYPVLTE